MGLSLGMGHLKSALSRSMAHIRKNAHLLLKEARNAGGLNSTFIPLLHKEGWREAPGWFNSTYIPLLHKEGWREAPGELTPHIFPSFTRRGGAKRRGGLTPH